MSYQPLSTLDLALAGLLVLINGALSVGFRLGLERSLAIAVVRMVAQLSVLGLVLRVVFAVYDPAVTLAIGMVMVAFAAFEVVQRQDRRLTRWWTELIAVGTMLAVAWAGTFYTLLIVVGPDPWYAPRYLLPILGMVAGNTLSSVGLALNTLTDGLVRDRGQIEARLALGATRWEACADVLRRALRTATLPIISQMSVTGLVTLPGMMSGQIIAGADPAEAAKYSIMIMFVLSGMAGLGAMAALGATVWRVTDARHRLRYDRLSAAS